MPITSGRIKLLVVDDSYFFRNALSQELTKDMDFEVAGLASDPFEARDKIVQIDPDVMVLDINLPRMNGVEFIKRLMAQYPIPIIVMSSNRNFVSEAIAAGAVDGLEKPSGDDGRSLQDFIRELSIKIKSASPTRRAAFRATTKSIIAIGASTGGTNAIADIMAALPPGLPGIVIVQHMPAEFTGMFANRLNMLCAFTVTEARNGDQVRPGTALVAPGDYQLRVVKNGDRLAVSLQRGEKVSGHCPSVDVMFSSVAESAGARAIGVLLTGMGQDGAHGLLSMKRSGARTIGQDEKSCIVYGMPKVAYDIGAVECQLPLNHIAGRVVSLL